MSLLSDDDSSVNRDTCSPSPPPFSPLTPADEWLVALISLTSSINYFLYSSDGMSVATMLQRQKTKFLPVDTSDYQRVVVRRRHIWTDALRQFKSGINFQKYIRIRFVGDPAVDEGGPMREFLNLLMGAVANNDSLFQGQNEYRVPLPNVSELEKQTYKYIGQMFAVSLLYGGPSPTFLAPSVVNYLVYGLSRVQADVYEVPNAAIQNKLKKVSLRFCGFA